MMAKKELGKIEPKKDTQLTMNHTKTIKDGETIGDQHIFAVRSEGIAPKNLSLESLKEEINDLKEQLSKIH